MHTLHNSLSSVGTKLSVLALALGASQATPSSAEAEQAAVATTAATHKQVIECVGSNWAGSYHIFNMDLTSMEAGGKIDMTLPMTEIGKIVGIDGLKSDEYVARTYRNYVYGYTEKGWVMYDMNNLGANGTKISVTTSKNENFKQGIDDIYFVEEASLDQDKMLIIGPKKIEIYAPFETNGDVKYPEFINGPESPSSTFTPTETIVSVKVIGNTIYAMEEDNAGKKQLTIYKLQGDTITMVGTPLPVGDDMDTWNQAKKVFVTCGDGKSKITYLMLRDSNADSLTLIDTTDSTKQKNLPGVQDMASVDPEGRYQFQSLSSGKTVVVDGHTGTVKDILPQAVYPLNGYVSWLPGFMAATGKPAFAIVDKQKKMIYQIVITDLITLEYKITATSFEPFSDWYNAGFGTGGGDCVNNPNVTGTVTVTGGNPEPVVVEADVVEVDKDAGSNDVGGETVGGDMVNDADAGGNSDATDAAIDAWMDGKGDMGEILADVPDTTGTPDTDGIGDKDAGSDVSKDASGDDTQVKPDIDATITFPDMGSGDTNPVQGKDNGSLPSDDASSGSDAVSSDGGTVGGDIIGSPIDAGKPGTADNISSNSSGCDSNTRGSSESPMTPATILFLSALLAAARRREERKEVIKR